MLDKHLIPQCAPVANEANIVRFADYRITVLSDRLFRIEKDAEGIYNDEATQSVWFRDMEAQKFDVVENGECVRIKTARVTIVVYADFEKSYAIIGKKKVKLNNDGNLLGTYRTLDVCDGNRYKGKRSTDENGTPIQLETGVVSKNGVAIFDDTKTLILRDDGKIYARRDTELDIYVFAFGNDYRDALRALYMITGCVPKIPKYALGNWWSRYYEYTDKAYLHVLDKFEKEDIPLTVATIDMDWHYSKDTTNYFEYTEEMLGDPDTYGITNGWTGYSWNKDLFPDYKGFLKKVEDRNLKITLNLHPAEGFRFFEDCYEEMATAMGIDPKSKRAVKFDVTNDDFINNYFKIAHKPFEHDGVHFWWIDWQQGTQSAMEGLDPLWSLNHYHYLDNGLEHEPLILSRYSGIGSHRYPVGFSGDAYMSWNSLDFIPYFTANASNAGYTWWSHDIGGHFRGIKDDELYLRYVQFGVFSPINRLHCVKCEVNTKEPWFHMGGTGVIAKDYLRLRHRMLPFLYSASIKNHKFGDSLIEPMYYEYPSAPEAYKYTNQYMFGNQLLVAPITTKSRALGVASVKCWLPEGKWTDIFTGDVYNGGRVVELVRHAETIPVLAREGGVFVTSEDNNGNSLENPHKLVVDVFNGNGEYKLYEDNESGEAVTTFTNTYSDGKQTTAVSVVGDKGVVPADRTYTFRFPNIETGNVTVNAKGKVSYETDDNGILTVVVTTKAKSFTIVAEFEPMSQLDLVKKMATKAITAFQGDNEERGDLYRELRWRTNSLEKYVQTVEGSNLPKVYKKRLLEFAF